MILAEELDADWNLVRSRHGSNDAAYVDPLFGIHLTGGSHSVKNSFTQYRELGARARAMLLAAAAARWKVDVATLRTEAGTVLGPGGRKLGYGELAEAAMALPVPEKVTLKDPKDFRIIGRPTARLDARAKSSGRQDFGIDVRLPGQLTAVVARPPVFGARLASVDDSAARAVKGVKAVLRVPLDRGAEGVAVVADGYWPAMQGREALKLQWDTSAVEKVDSERQLAQYRELADRPGARKFDADMAPLDTAPRRLEAEFVFPYLAHAAMEPLNCTVALAEGRAEVWTGSQCPGLDAAAVARVLGLKPEQVKVHVQMAGGGFGRRFASTSDFVVEACEIAKAARAAGLNAPVRTLWSREDDMRGGYYRPMHLHRARIGFDERGKVLAWDHVIVGQSITTGTVFGEFQVKNGIDATATEGMRDPYPLPMRLTVHHPKLNVPVLWWRSVGSTHTAFVMETLIDEIARATKQDPVAYRMGLFGDKHPRHRAALQLAVDKSGYGKQALPAGRAWGVAVHESFDSVVAYVVEASVKDGQPVLHRVTAGVHCNLAVNPLQRGGPGSGRGGHGPVDVPAGFGHHAQGRRRRAEQLRRLHRGPHDRHAGVRCPHRAQCRAAHRHGRAGPAAARARVRQRHRAADRQADAPAPLQPGVSQATTRMPCAYRSSHFSAQHRARRGGVDRRAIRPARVRVHGGRMNEEQMLYVDQTV